MRQRAALVALVFTCQLFAQTSQTPKAFQDQSLGFRFTPPAGMRDDTETDQAFVKKRAAELHTTKVLNVALSLRSSGEDTGDDWRALGIETVARGDFGKLSDREAQRKMARWVANIGDEVGEPTDAQVGGQTFLVSHFRLREGSLTKHADVYVTLRNGQVVALAFSGNSAAVVEKMEASLKTFETIPAK